MKQSSKRLDVLFHLFNALVKRLLEDLRTNKLSKTETMELAGKIERKSSEMKNLLDSSLDSL